MKILKSCRNTPHVRLKLYDGNLTFNHIIRLNGYQIMENNYLSNHDKYLFDSETYEIFKILELDTFTNNGECSSPPLIHNGVMGYEGSYRDITRAIIKTDKPLEKNHKYSILSYFDVFTKFDSHKYNKFNNGEL